MDNRWYINKVGLLNFWYYDEEEFDFSNGKLLLRGSNGSGKSVTMQSFIPLLLDGNKSPERLDPFGSRARKLENYLISEEDSHREERTAYLYMEFIKEESEKHLTIGMGFKAQRGTRLKSWGFAITDGRRIGHDLQLYKDIGDKIPLTKKELENRIGSGGMVKEGQGEYMKMVNDLLFGFDEIEEYDEMIKLLVQLRTPKLSKEFKPTVVYEIMDNSLQQLSEDDLRPMSEAIENMDDIKIRLEELKESKKAAFKIKDVYDKYNRFIIYDKAKTYIDSHKDYEGSLLEKNKLKKDRDNSKVNYEHSSNRVEELTKEQRLFEEKKKKLDDHDSMKIIEEIYNLDKTIESTDNNVEEKSPQLQKKKDQKIDLDTEIKKSNDDRDMLTRDVIKTLEDMDDLSTEFGFDEQDFMKAELERDISNLYNFNYIKNRLREYSEGLNNAKDALAERENQRKDYDNALLSLNKGKEEVIRREKEYSDAEGLLAETKEELIEKIYIWKKGNKELILDDNMLTRISRQINNFQEDSSFDDVISIVREISNTKQDILNTKISSLSFDIDKLKDEKSEIEDKIQEYKDKKDIEPERTDKVLSHRNSLMEKQIPYIPFYKAIDFKDNLSENVKGKLEESLLDMGLLDALIIPDKFKKEALQMDPNMGDKYIFSSAALLSHNLTEFLKIEKTETDGISHVDIDNALKSVFLDEDHGSVYINEKGEYGIGILKGKTTNSHMPKYIGTTARARFREEMINKLNIELSNIGKSIMELENQKKILNLNLETLHFEFKELPKDKDLRIAINQLREAMFNLEKAKEDLGKKEDEEQESYAKLKKIDHKVYELTHKFNLKANLEIYEDAIKAANKYQEELYNLINLNNRIVQNLEMTMSFENQKEDIHLDIDNLKADLFQLEKQNIETKNLKKAFEEQLKLSDYEEIKGESEKCLKRLEEIPKLRDKEISRSASENAKYQQTVDSLNSLGEKLLLKEKELQIYKDIFNEEFKLNYCNLEDLGEEYKNANIVLKDINLKDKRDKEHFSQQLFSKFSENTLYLKEYSLKIDNIFDGDEEKESKGKRLYINGKVRGKEIDFYELLSFIEEGIEENEGLLRESDRQLFEDILVNNISKKIRAKIYHSQKWVKRMNELMENMNTSSGLSFSLNWTNKKAESEGQLDTKELVELLKQEGSLMKELDLKKLSEHFRSKITEARRIQEDSGKNQSFHSIMREVLDYRKWFEFKLFYKKTGQNKKELTNNAFYQFSGGEKAMAMYVPLFSAVYARYEGARGDCPRLISLDEAFAGVDEKNIRDMFRLLNDLNLDYMINSQIIWGDYDTVSSLAISELIRPDNANFVTVIRYHWNGHVKELVV